MLPRTAARIAERYPVSILSVWFLIVALVTVAWRNVPVIDDWTYAWTVEHLLQTGRFHVLDWSSTYPLSQALWGSAWSALLGFSFGSLRVSTLVLGIVACAALYLLVRELGASRRLALVGAASLAVNPVFVFLSSSFMTDVPFIACTTMALLCYARAARRGTPRLVWWGGAWSLTAFLVRPVGIVTPAAGLPLLFMQSTVPAMKRAHIAAALAATWIGIGAVWLSLRHLLGTTSTMNRWLWNIQARPDSYLVINAYLVVIVGFYMLPALLASADAHGVWRQPVRLAVALAAMGLLLFAALGEVPLPLRPDQTWTVLEVGASRTLVNGSLPLSQPVWLVLLLRVSGLLAVSLAFIGSFGIVRAVADFARLAAADALRTPIASRWLPASRRRSGIDGSVGAGRHGTRSVATATLLTYIGAYLILTNILWMYLDRYYMVFIPPLVALLLGTAPHATRYSRPAVAALALFAVVGIGGTYDALRFNQAVHEAAQSLVAKGIPLSQIDAGYAWNGWWLYAHPANLGSGATPLRDVPWITSSSHNEYVVSTTRVDGFAVEDQIAWRGLLWPRVNRLFVLKRATAG
jgi:4-amino-4-deoxy-L-arabinose transferase-like glycosyltransferase